MHVVHVSDVTDIADSKDKQPVQPRNIQFPGTLYGTSYRHFNVRWYEQHKWLEYSVTKDSAFCFPCCFFSFGSCEAEAFTTTGFSDWKHATGKRGALAKHESCGILE